MPALPLQWSKKAQQRPTALLFLHRQSCAKLPPSSPPPSLGMRQARKEESQALCRRFRLLSKMFRDSNRKARRRKLPRSGAMAMANLEEIFLNGRLHQSRHWESQQRSKEATQKARALCAPIMYLQKEILPIPASYFFSLHLPVSEEARRTRRPSLPGKRKGLTSPPPGQKLRKQGIRKERIRAIQ